MRVLVISATLMLTILTPSHAEDLTAMDYCNQVFKTAKAIMEARQVGVELIKLAPKSQSDLGREMLVDAYSSPMYFTDEYKRKAESEFANQYYLDCLVNYR